MRILLFLLVCSISAFGQNSLHLHLQDTNKESLPFATILLKKSSDSSLVKGMTSDENGDLDIVVRPRQDSRVVRLNFTYRFGNMSIKGARERATGLESEKSRVKTK